MAKIVVPLTVTQIKNAKPKQQAGQPGSADKDDKSDIDSRVNQLLAQRDKQQKQAQWTRQLPI